MQVTRELGACTNSVYQAHFSSSSAQEPGNEASLALAVLL